MKEKLKDTTIPAFDITDNMKNLRLMKDQNLFDTENNQTQFKQIQEDTETSKKFSSNCELIIQPCEGPQTSNFFCVDENGGKIGRHSSNHILIIEESISRFHAEIIFKNDNFYLKDIGSTTGTFIKIDSRMLVEPKMIFELGSNQFLVEKIIKPNIQFDQNFQIHLLIIDGPNIHQTQILALSPQKKETNIGRKSQADLNFLDDQHLSNLHAKFILIENLIYIEDMGSTNGSWLRLSNEGVHSALSVLKNGQIFKIGTTLTYICKKKDVQLIQEKINEMCIICGKEDRDALLMPCKHNLSCLTCSKKLEYCPSCKAKVEISQKIFKN